MTGANIYLLKVNKSLLAARAISREVPVGKSVPIISGIDFNNQPITLVTSRKKATVLLAYSPTCPYCEKNWSTWTSLIHRVSRSDVDFVVVDLTGLASPSFVEKKSTGRATVLHRMDPKQRVALDLNATPQTAVIGQDGKVSKVWTGVLSPSDIAALDKLPS